MPSPVRRSLLPGHGKHAIAVLCVYELAALSDRSPLPTITSLTRRRAWGVVLVALLIHHLFIEP